MNRRVRALQHRLQPGLGGHTCAHRAYGKWAPQSASVRFPVHGAPNFLGNHEAAKSGPIKNACQTHERRSGSQPTRAPHVRRTRCQPRLTKTT
jgi:hypothetical protein